MYCGIELGSPCKDETRKLDKYYLQHIKFLAGRANTHIAYQFSYHGDEETNVYLPNPEITSLPYRDNVVFDIPEDLTFKGTSHLTKITKHNEKCWNREQQQEEEENDTESPIFGSARYYQAPYDGNPPSAPLRHALEGNRLQQRWNKWQDRNIANIARGYKKEIKKLKSQVSSLKRWVTQLASTTQGAPSQPRPTDQETIVEDSDEGDNQATTAHRHSMSSFPSSSQGPMEPPRFSHYEITYQRRRRRPRARTPTPSPPSSDNESIHASDSESDEF